MYSRLVAHKLIEHEVLVHSNGLYAVYQLTGALLVQKMLEMTASVGVEPSQLIVGVGVEAFGTRWSVREVVRSYRYLKVRSLQHTCA